MAQLQLGVVTTLVKDTVYSLPEKWCMLFCDASSPTIKVSNVFGMSPSITLTLDANGQTELAAGFIQSTGSSNIVVLLKTFA